MLNLFLSTKVLTTSFVFGLNPFETTTPSLLVLFIATDIASATEVAPS